ncbi:hypothetical protein [Halomarina pelagica]|uniref:hypothetical protein n=1 Tax=Halomarina pelagica TaxID=2961599 RepID=UPI0020C2D2F6|nr:hypothetical protein [Halomarina sp. BND7]
MSPSVLSDRRPSWALPAFAAFAVLSFFYAVLIEGAVLLWFVVVALPIWLYLTVRFLALFRRLVVAVERLANARER